MLIRRASHLFKTPSHDRRNVHRISGIHPVVLQTDVQVYIIVVVPVDLPGLTRDNVAVESCGDRHEKHEGRHTAVRMKASQFQVETACKLYNFQQKSKPTSHVLAAAKVAASAHGVVIVQLLPPVKNSFQCLLHLLILTRPVDGEILRFP